VTRVVVAVAARSQLRSQQLTNQEGLMKRLPRPVLWLLVVVATGVLAYVVWFVIYVLTRHPVPV